MFQKMIEGFMKSLCLQWGGLAIYISVIITSLIFLPIDKTLISIIIGGTVIVIGGIIDDIRELSPRMKFLFQIIGGALVLVIGGDVRIDAITNPFTKTSNLINLGIFSIPPLTMFWIVGITNTLNFIDGLDGLAAGVAMISSLSFF